MTVEACLSGAFCDHEGEGDCDHWTPNEAKSRWTHPNAPGSFKTAQALYLQYTWMGMPIQRSSRPRPNPAKPKRDISEDEKERLKLSGEL